jgi:hypothetical protein
MYTFLGLERGKVSVDSAVDKSDFKDLKSNHGLEGRKVEANMWAFVFFL